jgi:hypothetical protein
MLNKSILSILLAIFACANAFTVVPSSSCGIANRSSSSHLKMTVLTYGAKKADFKPGSPLKNACAKLGVKPKYSCKK